MNHARVNGRAVGPRICVDVIAPARWAGLGKWSGALPLKSNLIVDAGSQANGQFVYLAQPDGLRMSLRNPRQVRRSDRLRFARITTR